MNFEERQLPVINAKETLCSDSIRHEESTFSMLNPKAKYQYYYEDPKQEDWRIPVAIAIMLHVGIVFFLATKSSISTPTLQLNAQNKQHIVQEEQRKQEAEAIKAVSVDQREVMETVEKIKQQRLEKQQAENRKQLALAQQAEQARKQRLQEQQKIAKLKKEAHKLEKARKQKRAEEQARLQALEKKKAEEQAQLDALKKEQKQLAEKKQAEAALEKKKAQEALARKRKAEAEQAELEAKRRAAIAGEVNKYKALIINAISQQWILPEDVNKHLSSQFRIRLAPNGVVLDVSLVRSSGDAILDRSAKSAIYKASPLPVPSEAEAFRVFRDIHLTVRPESVRG